MCGLFGFDDYGHRGITDKKELVKKLAIQASVRGRHATGISYVKNNEIMIDKQGVKASEFEVKIDDTVNVVMGHTRHATQGNVKDNYNNHPFPGMAGDVNYALAHNGVLQNDSELRRELKLEKPVIQTDSYIAAQLIDYKDKINFDTLKFVGEKVRGSFTFSILDENNNLYFIKGDSPLVIYHFKVLKIYIYGSTKEIVSKALGDDLIKQFANELEIIEPKEGTIIKISNTGELTTSTFVKQICISKKWYEYNNNSKVTNYYNSYKSEKNTGKNTGKKTRKKDGKIIDFDKAIDAKIAKFVSDETLRDYLLRTFDLCNYTKKDLVLLLEWGATGEEIEQHILNNTMEALINSVVKDITKNYTEPTKSVTLYPPQEKTV